MITGNINADVTLSVQAPRDTAASSLGYHYDPIDYAVSKFVISNATLRLGEGVAVAGFATNANEWLLITAEGGSFVSEGAPQSLNRIVTYPAVQEQANSTWQKMPYGILTPYWAPTDRPGLLRTRFTQFSSPAQDTVFLQTYDQLASTNPIALVDCQFHGGTIWVNTYSSGPTVALTNNLFERVNTALWREGSEVHNNTFYGGTFDFSFIGGPGGVFNNTFDSPTISQFFDVTNGYNGYTTNCVRIQPTNANDIIVSSIAWQTGPLSRFYLPTNSPFLNEGSTTANNVGLFHFTITTNQVKETNSTVDIGAHWIASDPTGIPKDGDVDGAADYLEDKNGNGSVDSAETDSTIATDLGLRVIITSPKSSPNLR